MGRPGIVCVCVCALARVCVCVLYPTNEGRAGEREAGVSAVGEVSGGVKLSVLTPSYKTLGK